MKIASFLVISPLIVMSTFQASRFLTSYSKAPKEITLTHVKVGKNLGLTGIQKTTQKVITVHLKDIRSLKNGAVKEQVQRLLGYIINNDPVTITTIAQRNGLFFGTASVSFLVSGRSLMFAFPTIQELLASIGLSSVGPDEAGFLSQIPDPTAKEWQTWPVRSGGIPLQSHIHSGNLTYGQKDSTYLGIKTEMGRNWFYPGVLQIGQTLIVFGEKSSTGESSDNSQVGPFNLYGIRFSSRSSMSTWGSDVALLVLMGRPFETYKVKGSCAYLVTFPSFKSSDGYNVNCLNEVLLREGAVKCASGAPALFYKLQNIAKKEQLGLWSSF